MNKENRNPVNLDDNELDNIVGGAFNQNFIAQYNLKTLTGKSGAQGLIVKSVCFQSSTDGFSGMSSQGPCSEKRLQSLVGNPNLKSLEIQNNKGEWISFTRDQLGTLLKG